jgi:asparagine synthase (glutamine-hydrolysing)
MCGISGFIKNNNIDLDIESILSNMITSLNHRGSDDNGIWISEDKKCGFAHNRLSIIDLTSNGHQPMYSKSGKYIIIFNGEIYNHHFLRSILPSSINWKSNSDTETLIETIDFFGIEKSLTIIDGMFAFAIWDVINESLILARDKFGEKPLYYTLQNGNFVFSSEIKSIKKYPNLSFNINQDSLYSFLKFGFVNSTSSIYDTILKVEPGSFITFSNSNLVIQKYFDISENINLSKKNLYNNTYNNAIIDLDSLLTNSIQQKLISDVNIGVYLSSGVDSSLITAIYQNKFSYKPISTYTIGFENSNYNESFNTKKIAKYLNTNHTEIYIDKNLINNTVSSLQFNFDEPYADISAFPMLLLSKNAKSSSSVVFSGDGADELFGGYNRYSYINRSIFLNRNIMIKNILSRILNFDNHNLIIFLKTIYLRYDKVKFHSTNFDKNIHKLSHLLKSDNLYSSYNTIIGNSFNHDILTNNKFSNLNFPILKDINNLSNNAESFMFFDLLNYLPNNILYKYDTTTMLNNIEGRAPFLDTKLFEFSWRLPMKYKFDKNYNKPILRDLLKKYLPDSLINNNKNGFVTPISDLLRNDLKDYVFDILDSKNIEDQGLLNSKIIKIKLTQHMSGKYNWQNEIWNLIMFQSWMNNQNIK